VSRVSSRPRGARFLFLSDALFPVCLLFHEYLFQDQCFLAVLFFWKSVFSEVTVFGEMGCFREIPVHYSRALEVALADSGRFWRLLSPYARLGREFSCY